ncbi:hypothetical protein EXIGLDRAFT_764036 [Exidia glandulosa HHB12029]|uniref:Uncharacterized protein n=1 Tax=Exidia glandulosa HHB12029 TaxID=1314781 RepID=A0A165LH39_EXIGL|nr:hypothetical protein EXIGLDRAFT_764036 [Exidia glandulosa HHB12029]
MCSQIGPFILFEVGYVGHGAAAAAYDFFLPTQKMSEHKIQSDKGGRSTSRWTKFPRSPTPD